MVHLGILCTCVHCSPCQWFRLTDIPPTFAVVVFNEQQSRRASMRPGLQCLCFRLIRNHVYPVRVQTLAHGVSGTACKVSR